MDFWPASLKDILSVVVILGGAVLSGWKWLVKPLRDADKAQVDEIARIATVTHSFGAEVFMLAETVKEEKHSRDITQRDLGKLEAEVSRLAEQVYEDDKRRTEQHTATMQALGEISGQLKVIRQRGGLK